MRSEITCEACITYDVNRLFNINFLIALSEFCKRDIDSALIMTHLILSRSTHVEHDNLALIKLVKIVMVRGFYSTGKNILSNDPAILTGSFAEE